MTSELIRQEIEPLRELAQRAHQGTSFTPEKRAERMLQEYSKDLTLLLTDIPEEHHDWVTVKYVKMLSSWWYAKSRCISSMIAGPSNFPVTRAQKLNRWEEGHYQAFAQWRNSIAKKLERKANKTNWSLEGDIHRMTAELEVLKSNQERMKAANKILLSKRLSVDEKIDELQNIGFHGLTSVDGIGFASFQLTNNLNKIKTREARIAELQKRIQAREETPEETTINGIRVVENVADDRLQLFFEGIPAPAVRDILKRNGYRWSGKNQCWQSYLSGKWKLNRVLEDVEKAS